MHYIVCERGLIDIKELALMKNEINEQFTPEELFYTLK